MFSSRLEWDLRPNRISAAIEAKRRAGADLLDLTESNPTHAGLAYPEEEIVSAFADTRALAYEPSPAGAMDTRAAVAEYYAERGQEISPARILLTASTSEAYAYVFKLLCDAGDEVLVPRPSYPLFEFLARLEAVRLVYYPLVYDGRWRIDFDALRGALTARSRAVVLVNPNNPTGSFLKRDEWPQLETLCAEHGCAIISDEVFSDYELAPDQDRVRSLAETSKALTFSFSGLSKVAGLPQMKLGWIVAGGPVAERRCALERLELIADTYLSVSAPVALATRRLLASGRTVRDQISARTRANLTWLRHQVAGTALDVLDVEGGWYATVRIPRTRSEEDWALGLLEQENVLAQPGFFYDFESEAFLVLSLLTEPTQFQEGVKRLLRHAGRCC